MAGESLTPQPSQGKTQQPTVVASRRLLVFDEHGIPQMTNQNIYDIDRTLVDKVNFSALLLPYRGEKTTDPETQETEYIMPKEFEGLNLTNLEVAAIRAAESAADGNYKVYNSLLERVAGKSVDKSLNVSTNMSMQEFLDSIPGSHPSDISDAVHNLL